MDLLKTRLKPFVEREASVTCAGMDVAALLKQKVYAVCIVPVCLKAGEQASKREFESRRLIRRLEEPYQLILYLAPK
jgi:hypothetical protein